MKILKNCLIINIELISEVIQIPDSILGMFILAAGTSFPHVLNCAMVAKAGFGDMAISACIGSNIFDICIGIPLPILIRCCNFISFVK